GGRDGFGGGGGQGGGGPGMFGRRMLAEEMVSQADKDKDQQLSKVEFTGLADTWFDKMDSKKTGKLSQDQFAGKLGEVLNLAQGTDASGRGQPPGAENQSSGAPRAGGGPTGYIGTGLFTAADA